MLEDYGDTVRLGSVTAVWYRGANDRDGSCLEWTAVLDFGDKTPRRIRQGDGWRSAADPHPALLCIDPEARRYRIDGDGQRVDIGQGPRLVLISEKPDPQMLTRHTPLTLGAVRPGGDEPTPEAYAAARAQEVGEGPSRKARAPAAQA
jgi:hypothetical protein